MSISEPVFFLIDPYSAFYALFAANLVSHNSVFLHRPKKQNAHGGRNVMPRCLSEGVDIFLKSAEKQGESGHDVRVSQAMLAWLVTLNLVLKAMDGGRDASAAVDESITGEGIHGHDGRVT